MSLAPMTALNPVRCRGEHRQLSPNRLNQHDEREQTDYGYAQCGNGFEIGPFLADPTTVDLSARISPYVSSRGR